MPLDKDPKILSLIQAVRTNKVLYDIRHENYLDADHTNRIWKGVALQCGYDNGNIFYLTTIYTQYMFSLIPVTNFSCRGEKSLERSEYSFYDMLSQ